VLQKIGRSKLVENLLYGSFRAYFVVLYTGVVDGGGGSPMDVELFANFGMYIHRVLTYVCTNKNRESGVVVVGGGVGTPNVCYGSMTTNMHILYIQTYVNVHTCIHACNLPLATRHLQNEPR
jgi:hypothetical protein